MKDKDFEDYKDFDMSGANRGIHPTIQRLQAINTANKQKAFDALASDVAEIINKHANNPRDMMRINSVLRAMFSS